jgi:hypothetical protein
MAEKRVEKISVIVNEHLDDNPFEKAIASAYDITPKGSTVGVKIYSGGEVYGNYMCFKESTLSASCVAKCVNELLEDLLREVEDNG